jgi:hypothetical protein
MTESSDSRRQAQFVRAQLVQLIIQQATIFTNWVKFAITVQAGLAAGLGAVYRSPRRPTAGLTAVMTCILEF